MRTATILLLALASSMFWRAQAAGPVAHVPECTQDTLVNKPNQDGIIGTRSGRSFQALGQDFIDPTEWEKGETLQLCAETAEHEKSSDKSVRIVNVRRKESLETIETIRSK